MKKSYSEFLTVAIEAALQAGSLLRQGFGTVFEISSKEGHHNLVTTYDHLAESTISQAIMKRFPSHGFMGEEAGHQKKGDIVWIVDPLDGTVNFAHNVPVFCVSIGVAVEGKIGCGVVYQPITNELFWAEAGHGSFLNGKPIRVSSQKKVEDAYLATGFPYNVAQDPHHCIETFEKITRRGIPIRRLGSAAVDLSYVAAGRFDAYWEVSLQPWDLAAGLLIVEEAGGKVTHYDGSTCDPFKEGTTLASNSHIHDELRSLL